MTYRDGRCGGGRRRALRRSRRQLLSCDGDAAPRGTDVRRSRPARRGEVGHRERDVRTTVFPERRSHREDIPDGAAARQPAAHLPYRRTGPGCEIPRGTGGAHLRGTQVLANESSATFLPIAYLAVSQDSAPPPDLRIVLRSAVPPASLTHALTRAITEVAPASAVSYDAVSNYIDRLLVTERLMAWLSGCFA